MMQKLKEEITAAANRELNRANEQFPLFTSKHEGVAVAYEELEESKEALEEFQESKRQYILPQNANSLFREKRSGTRI